MTWLVADVGGTNARFALIAGPGAAPERIGTLRTRDYPGLAEAAAAYLERHAPDVRLDAACLAVAGPVANGRFRLTNADWPPGTADQVRAHLGLPYVEILNDFEGLALALPHLTEDDVVRIGPPPSSTPQATSASGPLATTPVATAPLATGSETPDTSASGQRNPGTSAATPAGTGTGTWTSDTRGLHAPAPGSSASDASVSGAGTSTRDASGFGGRGFGTLAVLGPGTGLGVGACFPCRARGRAAASGGCRSRARAARWTSRPRPSARST
ncbi:glucokinase [Actinomadura sp. J1-007]|uniref:glucokinase n=1 Tax=Actinomadura sp. J1-007 TaxID=2661913 RepID=UPI0028163933|nr:glucokinase [Actinomadura sp. J1-007]